MGQTGELSNDPLFVGLTRPTLFLGVNFMFVLLYALGLMMYYINSSDFRAFIAAPAIHMVGYVASFKEPLFMELFMMRTQKCSKCKNKLYYGLNSYDPY